MPYGSIYCTYYQLNYSSPSRSKKKKKEKKEKKSLSFGKWKFREKEVRRKWAKSRKGYDRKSNRTRHKNKKKRYREEGSN